MWLGWLLHFPFKCVTSLCCLCLCSGQHSPQRAEHEAPGGVHVQRAEETGLRRGLPLALTVHRLEEEEAPHSSRPHDSTPTDCYRSVQLFLTLIQFQTMNLRIDFGFIYSVIWCFFVRWSLSVHQWMILCVYSRRNVHSFWVIRVTFFKQEVLWLVSSVSFPVVRLWDEVETVC